jgi:hypothetical protein
MPTYAKAQVVLQPHHNKPLDGWLCPADGSLILVFSTGAVQFNVSDCGELVLAKVEPSRLQKMHKGEGEENNAADRAVDQVEEALRTRKGYGDSQPQST